MLVSTYWPYYSEMECKENHRRVMAACGRKVYDNYKYIIELGQVSGHFAPNPVRPLSRFAPIPVRPHLLIVL